MNLKNMQKTSISKDDLMEGVRLGINSDSLEQVQQIFIEKTGKISVVKQS